MLPGFAIAVVLHMGYNHLSHWPRVSALASLLVLAPLLYAVFQRSERALGDWLGQGFDADSEMLELINSGRLSDSPVGKYLTRLKGRFRGPVIADLLCYLRIYTELALRAKGHAAHARERLRGAPGRGDQSQVRRVALPQGEHRQDGTACA